MQTVSDQSEVERRLAILRAAKVPGTHEEITKRTGVSRSACHRWLQKLSQQGLIERRDQIFVTTAAGLKAIEGADFSHFPPNFLAPLWPQIDLMPTPLHIAALVISIISIAVRKSEIVEDLHIGVILAGSTQRLKSFVVKALCAVLRVDPKTIEMKMMQVRPRGMLERKDARGETVYESDAMKKDFVWMNELSRMDKAALRDLETLLHGSKNIKIENDVFYANATPILETNYKKASGTLMERLGFDQPIIRRNIVADFSNTVVSKDARVDSPEVLEKLQKGPAITLPNPQNVKLPREFSLVIETAVENAVKKAFVDSIDVARIATLVRGSFGTLPWEQATQQMIYYVFLAYESTEFLVGDWRSKLALQFMPPARTILALPAVKAENPPPAPKVAPAPTLIKPTVAPDWSKNPFDGLEKSLQISHLLTELGFSLEKDCGLVLEFLRSIKTYVKTHPQSGCADSQATLQFIRSWPNFKTVYDIAKTYGLDDRDLQHLAVMAASFQTIDFKDREFSQWAKLYVKLKRDGMSITDVDHCLFGDGECTD